MSKMFPGTYTARIVNYALSNNSKGNPQVEVLFEYNDGSTSQVGGVFHQIRWWGQLTGEKAPAYTLKTLALLGFKGRTDEDFYKLADGVESGMLDLNAEVELVLEEQTNEAGKTFMSIKYINDPNRGVASKNAMTKAEAKVKLGALGLAGQMAMVRAAQPQAQGPKPSAPATKAPSSNHIGNAPGVSSDFDFDI